MTKLKEHSREIFRNTTRLWRTAQAQPNWASPLLSTEKQLGRMSHPRKYSRFDIAPATVELHINNEKTTYILQFNTTKMVGILRISDFIKVLNKNKWKHNFTFFFPNIARVANALSLPQQLCSAATFYSVSFSKPNPVWFGKVKPQNAYDFPNQFEFGLERKNWFCKTQIPNQI